MGNDNCSAIVHQFLKRLLRGRRASDFHVGFTDEFGDAAALDFIILNDKQALDLPLSVLLSEVSDLLEQVERREALAVA